MDNDSVIVLSIKEKSSLLRLGIQAGSLTNQLRCYENNTKTLSLLNQLQLPVQF